MRWGGGAAARGRGPAAPGGSRRASTLTPVASGGLGYPVRVIDINQLRENPDVFRASQRARGADDTLIDRILEADVERRRLITEYESLRA